MLQSGTLDTPLRGFLPYAFNTSIEQVFGLRGAFQSNFLNVFFENMVIDKVWSSLSPGLPLNGKKRCWNIVLETSITGT